MATFDSSDQCVKEAGKGDSNAFTEAKDSFQSKFEHEQKVGLGLPDIYKITTDLEILRTTDSSRNFEEQSAVSSAREASAVTDSSILFAHILEETPDWLLGGGLDSSWTIEAVDDFSSSDDNESLSSLSDDFPPTPPQEQHHQAPPAGGLLCSLPCLTDLASVADGVCDMDQTTNESFLATLEQDKAGGNPRADTMNESLLLSSLSCLSDVALIAERLYEISDSDREEIPLSKDDREVLEDCINEMDIADMSFVLESSSELASFANAIDVPALKLNGIPTNADVLEASFQDMQYYGAAPPLRSLLSETWEPLGPAICITANVKARGLDKRKNDIFFGEATLRVLAVKVYASYTLEQFYEAVSKEVGGEVEIEGGVVVDEIEDFVSLRIPGFYADWMQSCVDVGGVGEIDCWRPQYYGYF